MIARRIALRPDMIASHPPFRSGRPVASAGWIRKTFALTLHMACLGLFGLGVVWPVVTPIASGELAREFKPVLEAWAGWIPAGR